MANPSRNKGTAAETGVVRWARLNGYPHADRQPLRGGRDQGDLTLCPGVIVEVKAHRLPTGVPTRGQLDTWLAQTEAERVNARADVAVLVVKRPGTTDPGRWFAYVTAHTLADLLTGVTATVRTHLEHLPVCMALADLTAVLRAAGWGALDDDQEAAS